MPKTYSDFMIEITDQELYDGLLQYGLFAEKLPPIFDGSDFLQYCKAPKNNKLCGQASKGFVSFQSMRNTNVPRMMGIPTPMSYERLCACLKDNWSNLQRFFEASTSNQAFIVSRTHIRKMQNSDSLFEMNYDNWRVDGTPEPDILIGKRYMVKADISNCFPSIYSHAIPWALVSKVAAKADTDEKSWQNQIDKSVRNTTYGETHGILIGPHTSNVISEIILCAVDKKLCDHWNYVRHIDDYECYVETKEKAEAFLVELSKWLRTFGLSLNNKKTEILELPVGAIEQWVRQLKDKTVYFGKFHGYVDYKEVQSFLDYCIELIPKNGGNASILFYALKVLNKQNLTDNAKRYLEKTMVSLSLIYPYLIPHLDKYVFEICGTDTMDLKRFINIVYKKYSGVDNFEAMAFSLFLAAKYDVVIDGIDSKTIIEKNDCILLLCLLIYARRRNSKTVRQNLETHARSLIDSEEMDSFWIFIYECLPENDLKDDWKALKKAKVSFLKTEYRKQRSKWNDKRGC